MHVCVCPDTGDVMENIVVVQLVVQLGGEGDVVTHLQLTCYGFGGMVVAVVAAGGSDDVDWTLPRRLGWWA